MLKKLSTLACILTIIPYTIGCSHQAPILTTGIRQPIPMVQNYSYFGLYQVATKMFHDTFVAHDTNKDGQLSIQEAGLDPQAFDELDLDKNQSLSEFEMFPSKMYWDFIVSIRQLAREEMEQYDKDHDKKLNYGEFQSYAGNFTENTAKSFQETDKDNNGNLTISEFEDFVGKMFAGQTMSRILATKR